MAYIAKVSLQVRGGGLHTRPSTEFFAATKDLDCTVTLSKGEWVDIVDGTPITLKDERIFDGCELMEILRLAWENGTNFIVVCEGAQAKEAFSNIKELFSEGSYWFHGSRFEILESNDE